MISIRLSSLNYGLRYATKNLVCFRPSTSKKVATALETTSKPHSERINTWILLLNQTSMPCGFDESSLLCEDFCHLPRNQANFATSLHVHLVLATILMDILNDRLSSSSQSRNSRFDKLGNKWRILTSLSLRSKRRGLFYGWVNTSPKRRNTN